jgi:two-component system sensor histidine kinase AlgZ
MLTEGKGTFWLFQTAGWAVYGFVVVLNTIPYADDQGMVAYRITLTATCLGGTFVLRWVCGREWRRGFRLPRSLLIVLLCCFVLTCICAALGIKAEYVWGTDTRPFNLLLNLTAFTNAGFVFLSWSALYFGIKYYHAVEAERRRVMAAERYAREAELRALRYQIHPHFLFNTLNAISTLVVERHHELAVSLISRLADFFRATLEEQTSDEVTLQDELFLTTQYLEIEKLRLGERLSVETAVDPALLACRVPHLILQPLVENAIRHGIAPQRESGELAIGAEKQGDKLVIRVTDDGLGKRSIGDQNHDTQKIGLININKRLNELYGNRGSLALTWPETGGCQAVLTIPFVPFGA